MLSVQMKSQLFKWPWKAPTGNWDCPVPHKAVYNLIWISESVGFLFAEYYKKTPHCPEDEWRRIWIHEVDRAHKWSAASHSMDLQHLIKVNLFSILFSLPINF